MLSGIVTCMLHQPGSGADLAPLGAMLPAVLSVLGEGIEAESSAGSPLDVRAAKCLLALVGQLTTGAPQALRQYLRQVGRQARGGCGASGSMT